MSGIGIYTELCVHGFGDRTGGHPVSIGSGAKIVDGNIESALELTGSQYATADSPGSDFTFAGDFTIEGFIYADSISGARCIIENRYGGSTWELYINSNKLCLYAAGSARFANTTLSTGTWYHIAVVRSGSTITFYLDGNSDGTTTTSATLGSDSGTIYIGAASGASQYFDGLLEGITVSNTARTISVPTAVPAMDANHKFALWPSGDRSGDTHDITIQNAGELDTSSPFAGEYGSLQFDGTDDYAEVADAAAFSPGTSDFVLECQVKRARSSTRECLIAHGTGTTASQIPLQLEVDASDNVIAYLGHGAGYYTVTGGTINDTSWHHVALIRSSGTAKIAIDGTLGSGTSAGNSLYDPSASVKLGIMPDASSNPFQGYLAEVRLNIGTDNGWSSNFTPATESYTQDVYELIYRRHMRPVDRIPPHALVW